MSESEPVQYCRICGEFVLRAGVKVSDQHLVCDQCYEQIMCDQAWQEKQQHNPVVH